MRIPVAADLSPISTCAAPARVGCVASTRVARAVSPRAERRPSHRLRPKRSPRETPPPAAPGRRRPPSRSAAQTSPTTATKKATYWWPFLFTGSEIGGAEWRLPADPVGALDLEYIGGTVAEKRGPIAVEIEVAEGIRPAPFLGPDEIQGRPGSVFPSQHSGAAERTEVEVLVADRK